MSYVISIVTAVSRSNNLLRIYRSMEASLARSSLKARWILVIDSAESIKKEVEDFITSGRVEVVKAVYPGGAQPPYGIPQKNLGMSLILDGYYHCLDDDNLVHPNFFEGIERAMKAEPSKRAFVFGQRRWDKIGPLVAAPDRMEYGKIDNTMFVVHSSLIGSRRYDLDRSGREDFSFFRKLYDLHPEEFVFIPETLAYYNYLQHFPIETTIEPIRKESPLKPPATPAPAASEARHQERSTGTLRIALYSSKRERCGISTYTDHLGDALASLGHEVRHWGSQFPHQPAFLEILEWKPDVLHVQHETSIMPPEEILCERAQDIRNLGGKVFVTLHTESQETIRIGKEIVAHTPGRLIAHRPVAKVPEIQVVPMPCTTIGAIPDKRELREKFRLPKDAFILSTVGFMIPWKDHPRLVESMLPWMKRRPDLHLQVIAAEHFNPEIAAYAGSCRDALLKRSAAVGGRVIHVDGYPSDRELVERLAASDLGYVWCPFDTGSSSAAAAQFITARCPLVATDSSHYAYLGSGIARGPKKSMEAFVDLIRATAEDSEVLAKLASAQWSEYRARNYIRTAMRHLELYGA